MDKPRASRDGLKPSLGLKAACLPACLHDSSFTDYSHIKDETQDVGVVMHISHNFADCSIPVDGEAGCRLGTVGS